jgi:hypothetical protein
VTAIQRWEVAKGKLTAAREARKLGEATMAYVKKKERAENTARRQMYRKIREEKIGEDAYREERRALDARNAKRAKSGW